MTKTSRDRANRARAGILQAAITRARQEIVADMRDGTVPADVRGFGRLHDFVDANCYGGLCDDHGFVEDCEAVGVDHIDVANDVQDYVHHWLQSGEALRELTRDERLSAARRLGGTRVATFCDVATHVGVVQVCVGCGLKHSDEHAPRFRTADETLARGECRWATRLIPDGKECFYCHRSL